MTPLRLDEVAAGLARVLPQLCGPGSVASGLQVMQAGHAGLTFGFDCLTPGLAPRGLILKLAPPGVRRLGNTDVYRQAPLLRALHAAGLPVPAVPFASDGEQDFGVPFIMMERLAGEPFFVWEPDAAFNLSDESVEPLWRQTFDAMVALHRFDWQRHLAHWEAPRRVEDELLRWDRVLAKSPDPQWLALGQSVRQRLRDTLPENLPVGLVHGDCQPGNALFHEGRLTGVIDWELSSVGCPWLDVGWMMMLADPLSWAPEWTPYCPTPPEALAARYRQAMGTDAPALTWFQAFAGYRLGAISCLNVHLHRSGRRPDALWERFSASVPLLFGRAGQLLDPTPLITGARA